MIALGDFVIPALAALMWIGFAAPTILRALGVPMAYGLWRLDRRNQHLSKRQWVWGLGVFSMGVGGALLLTLRYYLPRGLTGERHSHPGASSLVGLISSLAIAWLVANLTAPQPRISDGRPR